MTALDSALQMLRRGLWPVPITAPGDPDAKAPGKQPIGTRWGLTRHTEESLRTLYARCPDAGVGLKLGPEGGVIDIDVDEPEQAGPTLEALFGPVMPETLGWSSTRGRHWLFLWDDRLRSLGKAIVKLPGVELRIGYSDEGKQYQSVIPPSPGSDGQPRTWNGAPAILPLPESFHAVLAELMAPPAPVPAPEPRRMPPPPTTDVERRAVLYLARCDPAVAGQGGHDQAFKVACQVGPGFDLPPDTALRLLRDHYNPRCEPPWSERELRHKVEDAYAVEPRRGWLRDAPREKVRAGAGPAGRTREPGEDDDRGEEAPAWEEPVLDRMLPPIAFPRDVLPEGLASYIEDAAWCLNAPVDFLAVPALTIAGAAIGRSVALALKDTWIETPALYTALVGSPGMAKSPALKLIALPLWRITEEALTAHQNAVACCVNKEDAPGAPLRIAVDDSTCEALAPLLAENPRGLIMIRDELTAWVLALNQYKTGGKGSDRQFFLSAWSGAAVIVDRKHQEGRVPIHIPHPFLAIAGGLPPEMLAELVDARNRNDGFLDRILFAHPDPVAIRWRDRVADPDAASDWNAAIHRLWDRPLVRDEHGRLRPFVVHFTPDARAAFAAWFDAHAIEAEGDDFPPHLQGVWAKLRAYCGRLALILEQLAWAYTPDAPAGHPRNVTLHSVTNAIRVVDYFKSHAARVRCLLRGAGGTDSEDARALLRWVVRTGRPVFSERDARLNFKGRFHGDDEALADAIHWLEARHAVRLDPPPDGPRPGRPASRVYQVNPSLLTGA
jgi:hypothetical protein